MFYQSRIVKGLNSLKEPRAYLIATSRGSPAELDVQIQTEKSISITSEFKFPCQQKYIRVQTRDQKVCLSWVYRPNREFFIRTETSIRQ